MSLLVSSLSVRWLRQCKVPSLTDYLMASGTAIRKRTIFFNPVLIPLESKFDKNDALYNKEEATENQGQPTKAQEEGGRYEEHDQMQYNPVECLNGP